MSKKILIIAYYWPPAGGGGVQRWVKFVKYLSDFGWTPVVYTPQDADYPLIDESLVKEIDPSIEVIRHPIWEPRKLYRQLFGGGKKEGPKKPKMDNLFFIPKEQRSWKQNLTIWIRGNLIIPDARTFWVKPSVKYLKKYLSEHPVNAVITTGPPHSMHLIGKALKKQMGISWIADFRDPWTDIEFYDLMMLTRLADAKHRRLEKEVLEEADGLIFVSEFWNQQVKKYQVKETEVITNGYDKSDFTHEPPPLSDSFLISHVGTLANDRNPEALWQALKELSSEIPGFKEDLKVQVVGNTDELVIETAKKYDLEKQLFNSGYVSHAEAIRIMQSSQLLLLLINNSLKNAPGRIPGKIFEYLAARRPVLLIGLEESDSATIIQNTNSGAAADYQDYAKMKKILREYYQGYKAGKLTINSTAYEQYSRENLSRRLALLLDKVVKK